MRLFLTISLLVIFTGTAATLPAPAATTTRPPPGTCTVTAVAVDAPDVDTEGSGCRAGTVGVAFASDNSAMTLIFDKFQAAVGPNANNVKKRAFCRVNVTMSSPGWAFDVGSVDFRSYINIAKGVNASLVSRWKWIDLKGVDLKGKGNVKKVLTGPFENDFLLHKDGELSDSEESVCQKASAMFQISMSTTLSADSTSLSGVIQGDSADAKFGELLNLSWRKC